MTSDKTVDAGREMYRRLRHPEASDLDVTKPVDRGRRAVVADPRGRGGSHKPEALAARKRLREHYARQKNQDGSEFADRHQED